MTDSFPARRTENHRSGNLKAASDDRPRLPFNSVFCRSVCFLDQGDRGRTERGSVDCQAFVQPVRSATETPFNALQRGILPFSMRRRRSRHSRGRTRRHSCAAYTECADTLGRGASKRDVQRYTELANGPNVGIRRDEERGVISEN